MATILETESLNYSDVNLIAQPGKIKSRKEVPIEGWRIVVSGMTSIIGPDFIEAVSNLPKELQPTLHIPRDKYSITNLQLASQLGLKHIFVGVGLDTLNIEGCAKDLGFNIWLLDVANGYSPNVKNKVKELKKQGFKVCTGSVHTRIGYLDLKDAGCNIVRSGIAPGSVCLTSDSTGFTRGTFTEIIELNNIRKRGRENFNKGSRKCWNNIPDILADGGFKSPADLIKSFLAGADYCMIGRLFVDAKEARMRIDGSNIYYGMASELGKQAMGKKIENIEGTYECLPADNLQSLEQILTTIWQGIASGISYSGYSTLTEAIGCGVFEIKHTR